MQAVISKDRRELTLRGIKTHIVAEHLTKEINEFLSSKDMKLYFFFEGAPGPIGEGIVIRISLSKELSETDIMALKRFFGVRRVEVILE